MHTEDEALFTARAAVLSDLRTRRCAGPRTVSLLEEAVSQRRWWVSEWPEGAAYVAGQVAQDVQDALLDDGVGRWPVCLGCPPEAAPVHELRISPDLGPDPQWVCERTGHAVGPLGALVSS